MTTALNARLEAIVSHIVHRLADAAVAEMRARYDFGRVLRAIKRGGRHDDQTGRLRMLAKRLAVDPSALRRYARVSNTIPEREFAWMMRLRTPHGAPLTWSHIEALARVSPDEQRRQLALAAATECLSVRDLGARVVGA